MTFPDSTERRLAAVMVTDVVGFSGLVEANEAETLRRLDVDRSELMDPLIRDHHGRIVKATGDGLLVEFVSVVDAVKCAVSIQEAMQHRYRGEESDSRIRLRIGINLGDVVLAEDGDILGDGVNVAARLEAACEPGGVCVSDVVHQSVVHKLDFEFTDLGFRQVKSIRRPIHFWQWQPSIHRPTSSASIDHWDPERQEIRFTQAVDGVTIAYSSVGSGPPLVKAPNWMNHLEYDWRSPMWRHFLQELSKDRTLVRFDQRGTGLSDRHPAEISHDLFVEDLGSVVDAAGLERFPLLGISQGCAISIRYAAQHPERVSGLILYGGYARGRRSRGSQEAIDEADAQLAIIRHGWGRDDPAFRQFFTNAFMPDATPDQMNWFNELMRISTDAQTATRIRQANESVDLSDMLSGLDVPALVLHVRNDDMVSFEEGRRMAALLPNARFVPLEGRNHILLEDEPAWDRFLREVRIFLDNLPS